LKEGKVSKIEIAKNQLLPTDTISLKVGNSITNLIASGIYHKGHIANYKMLLQSTRNGSFLDQIIVAKRNFDDQMITIIWAGDLDGDNKVDLIIDTSRHYNVMIPTLYLSSKATNGTMVKCVAMHKSVGC
jgi:hypothetical protein